jgi:hypothetical protein
MSWCLIKHKDSYLYRGALLSTGIRIYIVVLDQAHGFVFISWCFIKHRDSYLYRGA